MPPESYNFLPEDQKHEGKKEYTKEELDAVEKEFRNRFLESTRPEREADEKKRKKELKLALSTCLAMAAGFGTMFYWEKKVSDKIDESQPEAVFTRIIETGTKLTAEKQDIAKKMAALKDRFGPNVFYPLIDGIDEAKQKLPNKPEFAGFENMGVDQKDMEAMFDPALYPQGTINGNIAKISYDGKFDDVKITDDQGRRVGSGASVSLDNREITLHPMRQQMTEKDWTDTMANLSDIVSHELGHKRDWEMDRTLTPIQRFYFMYDALEVYIHSTKWGSPSDIMDAENASVEANYKGYKNARYPKEERKAQEWWADFCSRATNDPDYFFDHASAQEIKLIEKWYVRGDKHFDFYETASKRDFRQGRIELKYQDNLTKQRLKNNPAARRGGAK